MSQEVLAKVAGEEITRAEFEGFLQSVPREQQAYISNPQFQQQCLEQLIALRVYAKYGEDLKLDETEDFKKMMANAKKDILAQMAMGETLKGIEISEEEMKEYYNANGQQFQQGATVNAKHILTETEEKCSEALATIESGEKSFEDVAKESSTCPSGAKGGDLGTFGKGQMVKEFEDAAFEAEIGKVIGPVQTQFGYHLIKVEQKNEATTTPFEEAKENIRRSILQQKQQEVYSAKLQELKEKYVEQ